MARPYWSGDIRVSLVTFAVEVHAAVSSGARIQLNQLHSVCGQRIRQPPTCPTHGVVDRSEIVKGYEFEKNRYVIVEAAEISAIKLRSEKTIDITTFVPLGSIDDVYLESTYYVAPRAGATSEPYRVVHEAMVKSQMGGIGTFANSGHEYPVLLRPKGQGFTLTTLRTAEEVRPAKAYFAEVLATPVNSQHLKLADTLIKGMTGKFDPAAFHDRYQDALKALVESKVKGEKPLIVQEEDLPQPIDFIEALKKSLAQRGSKLSHRVTPGARKAPARSEPGTSRSVKRKKA